MTNQELEAYDAMTADRDHWKARFKKLDKELMCELRDPCGTIWEHAEKLQNERDRLKTALSEIVACGLNCKDALDEAEQMEAIALCALNYCENEKISGDGPREDV